MEKTILENTTKFILDGSDTNIVKFKDYKTIKKFSKIEADSDSYLVEKGRKYVERCL